MHKSYKPQRPLNVMFLLSTMPVGGAETLLMNMIRKYDCTRIRPMITCMKQRDELGEIIGREIQVFDHLLKHKYDVPVINRLKRLFRDNQVDAVITVGAGDKMFWGRVAAYCHRVPVILSALHSTGWPDGIGKLNRMLTCITDGFIAVAKQHAEFQVQHERFPESKVFLIPNGIDTDHFQFDAVKRDQWRRSLAIPIAAPVVSIVAALRPEKNHELFLNTAKKVTEKLPQTHFVIAGEGALRNELEALARSLGLAKQVHFLGSVSDVAGVLSMSDLFVLTSSNEASPVSIMEALSCQRPVVAPDVGSINETVLHGQNGFLFPAGNVEEAAQRWLETLTDHRLAQRMGSTGRAFISESSSLQSMTDGYTALIESIYLAKESPVRLSKRPLFPSRKLPLEVRSQTGPDGCPIRSA